jgi:hypothetical protein
MALSEDIFANGLRDPITLTPDGQLLDGRNRVLAAIMAGIDPTTLATEIHKGDPWAFSLSRNKFRRHLNPEVTASQGGDRRSENFKTAGAGLKIADAAEKAGVTKTKVESACTVLKCGTPEEIAAIRTGVAKVRPTADKVRARRRLAPPAAPKPKSVKAPPAADPIIAVADAIISQCGDGKKWSASKIATTVKYAEKAVREALIRLGDSVEQHKSGIEILYRIPDAREAALRRQIVAKDAEIARLEARIAEQDAEIKHLKTMLVIVPSPAAPSLVDTTH